MKQVHCAIVRAGSLLTAKIGVLIISSVVVWMLLVSNPLWAQSSWPSYPNNNTITVTSSGNVGIGTTTPTYRLDAVGGFAHFGYNTNGAVPPSDDTNGGLIVGWNRSAGGAEVNLYNAFGAWGGGNEKSFVFSQKTGSTTYVDLLTIRANGNVGIGTTSPQYKLAVNGTIGAKEVIVTNSGWPDYVFQPGYRLKPLSEVASYIQAHRHLPDIPTEAEVKAKGIGLGDMQAKLLAKIEELTLHVIQQDKENRDLRERLARLEARVAGR